jgi:uncharacterized repeat protein (TIGR04076 family)
MQEGTLTESERQLIDRSLKWAKECELVRTAPGRKLLRVVAPDGEECYGTLMTDPEPKVILHEPVRFIVTVQEAKGECRAEHKVGDRWEFDWCTPAELCGSAYHTMYPLLHGLMLSGGRYEGAAAEGTLVSCPDEGWITFRIERQRWTPEMWEKG